MAQQLYLQCTAAAKFTVRDNFKLSDSNPQPTETIPG